VKLFNEPNSTSSLNINKSFNNQIGIQKYLQNIDEVEVQDNGQTKIFHRMNLRIRYISGACSNICEDLSHFIIDCPDV
jgi:hypothetical protein